ncbi:MAG: hypothetical protein WBN22_02115 [Verrucomicrobiia bacterium]
MPEEKLRQKIKSRQTVTNLNARIPVAPEGSSSDYKPQQKQPMPGENPVVALETHLMAN